MLNIARISVEILDLDHDRTCDDCATRLAPCRTLINGRPHQLFWYCVGCEDQCPGEIGICPTCSILCTEFLINDRVELLCSSCGGRAE